MRLKLIPLLAAIITLALAGPAHASSKPWVFMLAGQSNMQGQGFPIPPSNTDPRILRQGNIGAPWTVATDPLDGFGAGPAIPFAREILRRHPNVRIVLVPCAKSGSYITQWQPGTHNYARCIAHTQDAVRRGGVLKGILVAQGESDATGFSHGPYWARRYQRMVRGMRDHLGAHVPVVHTVIGKNALSWRAWGLVQAEQRRRFPFDTAVETHDLKLRDSYHYTVPGYRTLGQRMGRAWEQLALRP